MKLGLRGTAFINLFFFGSLCFGGMALAGPVSRLYLTAGDQQTWFIVQGNTVNQLPEVHAGEYALAVQNTVRTLNVTGGAGLLGNEYTLAGTPLGATYANNFGSEMIDGTTDGRFNYAVQWNFGTVVRFDLNWSSPVVVATGLDGDTIGITYNPSDGTFWTASRQTSQIYHYSSTFSLLGSFATGGGPTGLAYDPADGTLWTLNQSVGNRLEQYSTGGTLLSTLSSGLLAGVNTLGAEFSLVPEPTAPTLLGIGALAMLRAVRRRRNTK